MSSRVLSRSALLSSSAAIATAALLDRPAVTLAQVDLHDTPAKLTPIKLAPGVFALQAPPDRVWCNISWVVFKDYTLVLDGGTHFEAEQVLPAIKSTTDVPVRLVLNTHHHGDHSYGNAFWVENGATVMGNAAMRSEYARLEPARLHEWPAGKLVPQFAAELAETHLHPPSILLPTRTTFDDGNQRVELLHFGPAHTMADTLAWLPKQKILASGDVVVNGPFNVMWDAHVLDWIKVLDQVEALGALTVIPGHGPVGDASMIVGQRAYFIALRERVRKIIAEGGNAAGVRAAVPKMKAALLANPQIARWTITNDTFLPDLFSLSGQMGRFYSELTGKPYLAAASLEERYAAGGANVCCAALIG
jgi:cyclase